MSVFANDEVFGRKYAKIEGFHLSPINQTDTSAFADWHEKKFSCAVTFRHYTWHDKALNSLPMASYRIWIGHETRHEQVPMA